MKKPIFNQEERRFIFNCLNGTYDFPNDYLVLRYNQVKAKQYFRKEIEKCFNPIIEFMSNILNK